MQTLNDWLNREDIKEIRRKSPSELSQYDFFRDPIRSYYIANDYVYSPADGTISYINTVKLGEKVINIKGQTFTIEDLLQNEIKNIEDKRFVVIGIFMCQYDVHINRIPLKGFLKYKKLPPIRTNNLSMTPYEETILNKKPSKNRMEWLFWNERILVTVRNNIYGKYYMVLIADREVDSIYIWKDKSILYQNERFGEVRFGSEVDLIFPASKVEKILCKLYYHVEAGIDKLLKLRSK